MLGREDQDLVDAAGRGLGEDGPAVGHHEGLVTLEGRVEVGHDADEPAARRPVGLECRRGVLLVARAEGAGPVQGVGHLGAGHEGVGPLGAAGADHHPATGQRVETELVHRCALSGGSATLPRNFIIFPPPLTVQGAPAEMTPRSPRRHLRRTGHGRTCRACTTSPTGAAFDIVLLLHVVCVVAGLVTTVTAAATAARLRRLLAASVPPPEPVRRYFRPGVNWAGPRRLGHPGLRVRAPRHEPGGLRAARRLGHGRAGHLRGGGPARPRACSGRPSAGSRSPSGRRAAGGRTRRRPGPTPR